ncbi:MAG: tRNA-uridine aminocarboxypropyltransferase [Acidobacteriota bacterium]|nr:tRNA-uridine aminocarboxypropyltransferase [Acidobacteriota bacterium]
MSREPRQMCWRCHKAAVVCICNYIVPVSNRTGIIILQHPEERFHPIGTARIARLSLSRVKLIVRWAGDLRHLNVPLNLPPGTGLLYPGPTAADLAELPPHRRPDHLVVLDGTWRQAKALFKSEPELAGLPRFAIHPEAPSRYRIRREPEAHCLSTIESINTALHLLEPDNPSLDHLLKPFDAMVQDQLKFPNHLPKTERGCINSRYSAGH